MSIADLITSGAMVFNGEQLRGVLVADAVLYWYGAGLVALECGTPTLWHCLGGLRRQASQGDIRRRCSSGRHAAGGGPTAPAISLRRRPAHRAALRHDGSAAHAHRAADRLVFLIFALPDANFVEVPAPPRRLVGSARAPCPEPRAHPGAPALSSRVQRRHAAHPSHRPARPRRLLPRRCLTTRRIGDMHCTLNGSQPVRNGVLAPLWVVVLYSAVVLRAAVEVGHANAGLPHPAEGAAPRALARQPRARLSVSSYAQVVPLVEQLLAFLEADAVTAARRRITPGRSLSSTSPFIICRALARPSRCSIDDVPIADQRADRCDVQPPRLHEQRRLGFTNPRWRYSDSYIVIVIVKKSSSDSPT